MRLRKPSNPRTQGATLASSTRATEDAGVRRFAGASPVAPARRANSVSPGCHVGQQRQLPRAFDRAGELALVPPAAAGDPGRPDLALVAHRAAQRGGVLVVDKVDLVAAERAWLTAPTASRPSLVVPPAVTRRLSATLPCHALSSLPGHRNYGLALTRGGAWLSSSRAKSMLSHRCEPERRQAHPAAVRADRS